MMSVPRVIYEKSEKERLKETQILHQSCNNCSFYINSKNWCQRNNCPFISERITAKQISFAELLFYLIIETYNEKFCRQLVSMYENIQKGRIKTMFSDGLHEKIFNEEIALYEKRGFILTDRFTAALYVLTSNKDLWSRARYKVEPNKINFKAIDIKGISTDGYLLFNFAQDIIFMTKKVSIQELTDRRITNDKAFNIIVNSILIARYGKQTVKLNLKSNEGG